MAGYQSPTHQGWKTSGTNPYPIGSDAHREFAYGRQCREAGMNWHQVQDAMSK